MRASRVPGNRAQESPGEPRRPKKGPGEPKSSQETSGEPMRVQKVPGNSAQETPAKPRRAYKMTFSTELMLLYGFTSFLFVGLTILVQIVKIQLVL